MHNAGRVRERVGVFWVWCDEVNDPYRDGTFALLGFTSLGEFGLNACQDAILESVSVGEEFERLVWGTGGVLGGWWVKDEFDC